MSEEMKNLSLLVFPLGPSFNITWSDDAITDWYWKLFSMANVDDSHLISTHLGTLSFQLDLLCVSLSIWQTESLNVMEKVPCRACVRIYSDIIYSSKSFSTFHFLLFLSFAFFAQSPRESSESGEGLLVIFHLIDNLIISVTRGSLCQ